MHEVGIDLDTVNELGIRIDLYVDRDADSGTPGNVVRQFSPMLGSAGVRRSHPGSLAIENEAVGTNAVS